MMGCMEVVSTDNSWRQQLQDPAGRQEQVEINIFERGFENSALKM